MVRLYTQGREFYWRPMNSGVGSALSGSLQAPLARIPWENTGFLSSFEAIQRGWQPLNHDA